MLTGFVTFEGIDGSGKTTVSRLVTESLRAKGSTVYLTSEPTKTWLGDAVRHAYVDDVGAIAESFLFLADRAAHLTDIRTHLRKGELVLCDRYIFTAFARDIVRGCPPEWVRGVYNFAALPDVTFFFKADLEVSLQRILDGRPQLKYFEAGMDLRLASDPYESFRIFQGRILEQYLAMSTEFKFLVIDANQLVEAQQVVVRKLVAQRIDLEKFKRNESYQPAEPLIANKLWKQEEPHE